MTEIRIAESPEQLSEVAAAFFVETARLSIEEHGTFTVALSGGTTPKRLLRGLVSANLDWGKVFFFFGDERNVPPDHEQSNFRMADEALFQPLNIDKKNIYRWKTEIGIPTEIANDYAYRATSFFHGFPRFDLILLGLGTDGHTASLFPNTKALFEESKIAVDNWVEKLQENRFTLTFPVINNAANTAFLASGTEKAAILKNIIEGAFRPNDPPARSVSPQNGILYWFVDKDAASQLSK